MMAVDAATSAAIAVADEARVTRGEIKRGQPFFVAMQRAGVSPIDIQSVVSASKEYFNFKANKRVVIQPGARLSLKAAKNGPAVRLKCMGTRQSFVPAGEDAAKNEAVFLA